MCYATRTVVWSVPRVVQNIFVSSSECLRHGTRRISWRIERKNIRNSSRRARARVRYRQYAAVTTLESSGNKFALCVRHVGFRNVVLFGG